MSQRFERKVWREGNAWGYATTWKWIRVALVVFVLLFGVLLSLELKVSQTERMETLLTQHISKLVVKDVLGLDLRRAEAIYGIADKRARKSRIEELASWEFGSFGMQLQIYRDRVTRIIFQTDDRKTRELIYERVAEEFSESGSWNLSDRYPSDHYLSVVIDREKRIRVCELDRSVRIYGYLVD